MSCATTSAGNVDGVCGTNRGTDMMGGGTDVVGADGTTAENIRKSELGAWLKFRH